MTCGYIGDFKEGNRDIVIDFKKYVTDCCKELCL